MGLTGKYDFKGIKKAGAFGIRAGLASSPGLSWILKIPLLDLVLEMISNWMANKGLIILNVGAFYVNGELDQSALDKALDSGIARVDAPGAKLTPQQIKEIDDAVIRAADRALPYGRNPS